MKAVFLDRDGVLNEEVDYLRRVEDLKLIPGAAKAVLALNQAGYKVIVISNQSGVARGYFDDAQLRKITAALKFELAKVGAKLDAVYYCRHHAEQTKNPCKCRKPGTLLLKRAQKRLKLDFKTSYFIGDTTVDIKTAKNAGVTSILVRTGKAGRDKKYPARPDKTAKDLAAAVRWLLSR